MEKAKKISEIIGDISYIGRGIIIGKTENGKAVITYFITGRSLNSRNRIFELKNGELFTKPFDETKVEDASLIIYSAIRRVKKFLIVTNGDQTDTVYNAIKEGKDIYAALRTRTFEPDAPNFTPRISGVLDLENGDYTISILKAGDNNGTVCDRQFYEYEPTAGAGRFISTYERDGNPLPSFTGEPKKVIIPKDIDEFKDELWSSLDKDNKISLYVEYIDLKTGESEYRLINKNK